IPVRKISQGTACPGYGIEEYGWVSSDCGCQRPAFSTTCLLMVFVGLLSETAVKVTVASLAVPAVINTGTCCVWLFSRPTKAFCKAADQPSPFMATDSRYTSALSPVFSTEKGNTEPAAGTVAGAGASTLTPRR